MYGDTVITTAAGSSINVIGGGDYGTIGINAISYSGNISVTNAGSLTVTAVNDAEGIHLYSDYGNVSVSNSGAVTVSSSSGNASGIYAETGDGTSSVTNSAAITVTAAEYAVGIYAYANGGNASVTNSAAGHVRATGDSATGISVQSNSYGYDVTLNNAGKITVVGNDGDAYGAYVETDGDGTLSITSSGDITVSASGIGNYAVGLYAQHEGYGDITIASSSTITVNSTGSGGDAVGIRAYSYYGSDMSVSNSGTILANATNGGLSVGIYTQNDYGTETTITNSGSVKATSNAIGDAHAIYHVGTDVDIINTTTGKIFGVVYTDFGNDTFTNNGKWYATQGTNYYSGFFSGNDDIVNSSTGKIYMEDSFIDLGSATTVNSFLNNGKIYVNGDENYIDMGNATSVFTNNGASLHFEDGAANDVLTIFGDFAGTGHIVVDANGTSMLADRLYIEGDVVSSTANVIDVYLNQNPSLQDMVDGELIDIVYVSGTSAAANFNLGIVDVEDDSLYTVDYELVKQINYSGTNDLFSLGFEISGLTPTGVAMSSIAPTVQNLWHLGVGTVFQREGTVRDLKSGGSSNSLMNAGFKNATGGNAQVADYQGAAGLWLRAFTEDGGLNPDGGRDNFGLGGAQSFDMKNSGIEFGAGYAFNSQWTAGLLGGVSDGSLKPTIGGRTSIDAKTIGGYLTYTPGNGFYADLSYRSMDFDGNGNGGGDDFSFDGKADGYSLEMGYGFKTSSGLVVEPQFQYSSMDVDLDSVDYNQGGFALDDGKSSQTRLGVSLRKTMDSGNGNSWTPYASLSYLNESNASNDYTIGGVLTGNVDTSGNSTLFEGGATVKYGNMLFSGGLNWKDGGAYESVFGGQVSVRFSW
jgi:outer membrane autotransporter protein